MVLDQKMCKLIAELEYLIGSECYNPNSYDGWQDIDGCDFRYPISIPDNEGNYSKVRANLNFMFGKGAELNENTIPFIKYKFGSNELFIGQGIIKVLEYLQNRYSINFAELEDHINKK